MISKLIELITAFLKAIPILDQMFKEADLNKEQELKTQVDSDHEKVKESGRPEGSFWKGRG